MRQFPQRPPGPMPIGPGVDINCFTEMVREPLYVRKWEKIKLFDKAYLRCDFQDADWSSYDIAAKPERKECMVNLIRQGMNFWEAARRCTQKPYASLRRMRWAGLESNSWLWLIAAGVGFWLFMKE